MTDIVMSRERFADGCWSIRAYGGAASMSLYFYGTADESRAASELCKEAVRGLQVQLYAAETSDEPATAMADQ
jgi:hypothetical protein